MKNLKELWEKCGDEKFTLPTMTLVITCLTLINLFILEIPEQLRALLVMLNLIVILLNFMEE